MWLAPPPVSSTPVLVRAEGVHADRIGMTARTAGELVPGACGMSRQSPSCSAGLPAIDASGKIIVAAYSTGC
jgi:hypothetical protein